MPRDRSTPPTTDVPKQIKNGIKVGAIALLILFVLFMCARSTLRRLFLHQPRFEAGELATLPHHVDVIAAGNMNGDQFSDIIVAYKDTENALIDIFVGSPAGYDFEHPFALNEPFNPQDLILGDITGDGLDEILATTGSTTGRSMIVWWNRGGMVFQRDVLMAPLRFADVIDEDQDGQMDVIGVRHDFSDVLVFRGEGGTIAAEPAVEDGVNDRSIRDIDAAHLDGSGMDIAIMAENRVRVLRSGGIIPDLTTYFNLPPLIFPVQQQSRYIPSLILDDLNGDRRPDLAYIDAGTIRLQLGLGGGSFREAKYAIPGQPASRVVRGNFNEDEITDLLTVSTDETTIQFLHGQ